jgi:hypothetical protein
MVRTNKPQAFLLVGRSQENRGEADLKSKDEDFMFRHVEIEVP